MEMFELGANISRHVINVPYSSYPRRALRHESTLQWKCSWWVTSQLHSWMNFLIPSSLALSPSHPPPTLFPEVGVAPDESPSLRDEREFSSSDLMDETRSDSFKEAKSGPNVPFMRLWASLYFLYANSASRLSCLR